MSVLVVEDDSSMREALDSALRTEGYRVRAEADGGDIQRVFEEFNPDLAILDVRLTEGPDGVTLASFRGSTGAIKLNQPMAGVAGG